MMIQETDLAKSFKSVFGIDPLTHDGTFSLEQVRRFAEALKLPVCQNITKSFPDKRFVRTVAATEQDAQAYHGPAEGDPRNLPSTRPEDARARFAMTLLPFFVDETIKICDAYNLTRYHECEPKLDGRQMGNAMAEAALLAWPKKIEPNHNWRPIIDAMKDATRSALRNNAYHYVQNWRGTRDIAQRVLHAFLAHREKLNVR